MTRRPAPTPPVERVRRLVTPVTMPGPRQPLQQPRAARPGEMNVRTYLATRRQRLDRLLGESLRGGPLLAAPAPSGRTQAPALPSESPMPAPSRPGLPQALSPKREEKHRHG